MSSALTAGTRRMNPPSSRRPSIGLGEEPMLLQIGKLLHRARRPVKLAVVIPPGRGALARVSDYPLSEESLTHLRPESRQLLAAGDAIPEQNRVRQPGGTFFEIEPNTRSE
jgi:hypothetical protein